MVTSIFFIYLVGGVLGIYGLTPWAIYLGLVLSALEIWNWWTELA